MSTLVDDDWDNKDYAQTPDSLEDLRKSEGFRNLVNPDSIFDDPEAEESWEDDYEWE